MPRDDKPKPLTKDFHFEEPVFVGTVDGGRRLLKDFRVTTVGAHDASFDVGLDRHGNVMRVESRTFGTGSYFAETGIRIEKIAPPGGRRTGKRPSTQPARAKKDPERPKDEKQQQARPNEERAKQETPEVTKPAPVSTAPEPQVQPEPEPHPAERSREDATGTSAGAGPSQEQRAGKTLTDVRAVADLGQVFAQVRTAGDLARVLEQPFDQALRATSSLQDRLGDWVAEDGSSGAVLAATLASTGLGIVDQVIESGRDTFDILHLGEGFAEGGWGAMDDVLRVAGVIPGGRIVGALAKGGIGAARKIQAAVARARSAGRAGGGGGSGAAAALAGGGGPPLVVTIEYRPNWNPNDAQFARASLEWVQDTVDGNLLQITPSPKRPSGPLSAELRKVFEKARSAARAAKTPRAKAGRSFDAAHGKGSRDGLHAMHPIDGILNPHFAPSELGYYYGDASVNSSIGSQIKAQLAAQLGENFREVRANFGREVRVVFGTSWPAPTGPILAPPIAPIGLR